MRTCVQGIFVWKRMGNGRKGAKWMRPREREEDERREGLWGAKAKGRAPRTTPACALLHVADTCANAQQPQGIPTLSSIYLSISLSIYLSISIIYLSIYPSVC